MDGDPKGSEAGLYAMAGGHRSLPNGWGWGPAPDNQ